MCGCVLIHDGNVHLKKTAVYSSAPYVTLLVRKIIPIKGDVFIQ